MTLYRKLEIDLDGQRAAVRDAQSGFSAEERSALLAIYDAVEAGRFTEACQLANAGGRSVLEGIAEDVHVLLYGHAHGEVYVLPNANLAPSSSDPAHVKAANPPHPENP